MDKSSNSKFQFRLPDKLSNDFKIACDKIGVNPSKKIRELISNFLLSSCNDELNTEPYVFPDDLNEKIPGRYTIGEMYCGPGGLGLASKMAKFLHDDTNYFFKHIWATDYHLDTCLTYQNNISKINEPKFKVINKDIKDLSLNILPYVDGFIYGFPCNDFSNVGETKGLEGKFGPLYTYGVRYIEKNNPKFIFAENVSGLSGANSGKALSIILNELENAGKFGYELTSHLYKFEDYGVPQARHRYIIVGFRKDLDLKFKIPKPTHQKNFKNSKDAITIPPISSDSFNNEHTLQSKKVVERLKYIKPGENAWNANIPDDLKLNVKGAKLSMIYKRLDPQKPAYTVTGSGGGGTHMYHWKEDRALTNRERARLQTFPDNFKFIGSKESVRRQIGMAVPVDGAKIILNAILKTFANISYDNIDNN